jgi:acylpyruvate hydrolase
LKLVTYTAGNEPRLGALSRDGKIIDLNRGYYAFTRATGRPVSARLCDATVPPEMVAFLENGDAAMEAGRAVVRFAEERGNSAAALVGPWDAPVVYDESAVKLRAPILRPPKIIGIGLNYRDHAEEQGAKIPRVPLIFAKFATSIIGPGDAIVYPKITEQLDYEAELAFVIGKGGKSIPVERAYEHIAGYCVFNDVTARDVQLSDRQWVRGKTPDTLAPIGPWLVTRDEVPDPGNLKIQLWLNDQLLQDSRTDQLIFDIPYLVNFLSEAFTLEPGDVVATGTPGGVGFVRKPAVFMNPGDRVRVEIERLGVLENSIVAQR